MIRSKENKSETRVTVKITPRSSKNMITGVMNDGTIKIKLTAPPVDGKANQELVKYISDVLNINNSNIEILAGHTSRIKILKIAGLDREELKKRILLKTESE